MTRFRFPARPLLASLVLIAAAPVYTGALAKAPEVEAPRFNAADQAQDPLFSQPYIDIDEWRDAPVRHRYVHGGFRGTETRFSFYLPPKAQYQGRFFQHLTPAPDNENLAQREPAGESNKIGFAISSGGYFVETNGGGQASAGFGSKDPTIGAYRANAAAARYSRVIALQMYGGKRPYGYVYGGSGGAYRTVGSFENTRGVWDGAVPYVMGSTMAIPNMFSVRMHAMRILKDKFPQIVDAVEPGGSGDPYAGLTPEQASALREVTRMGFPTPSWFGYKTMGIHGFAALYGGVVMADPGYFTDFWTKPGYLGHDSPESLAAARLQHQTTIAAPLTGAQAAQAGLETRIIDGKNDGGVDKSFAALQGEGAAKVVAFRLTTTPPDVDFMGGDLIVQSGAAKGKRLTISRLTGDLVILVIVDPATAALLAPGDQVQVDNSNFLAAQTYHRHQVPGPEFKVWDQFRKPDGQPAYPQRPMLLGPIFTQATAGSLPKGDWDGKMILVGSLWDREAMPWQSDWYRQQVNAHHGAKADDDFRLWYVDHALHGDQADQLEDPTRTVSYLGVLHQALRDVSAWVEHGVKPPASTGYRIEDGQVKLPVTAAERAGVQPVVTLSANGGEKAKVAAGEAVSFVGTITVPPGAGSVVAAEWDFDGAGKFPVTSRVPRGARKVTVRITHRFDKPGTYFPALRGISQRKGDTGSPYARIRNLGRVRVVVE